MSTPVFARALTLDAIRLATGLSWIQVDLAFPELPSDQGVYVWVETAPPHALWYHGSGSGNGGLRRRLADQLRWRSNQVARLSAGLNVLSEQDAWDLAREVPAVQQSAREHLLFYAVARPASWAIPRSTITPPTSALQWESFISALSLLATGHRGLVGGGAWESKAGTVADLMTELAWDRLVDLQGGSWL